jgi:hypothetical protein
MPQSAHCGLRLSTHALNNSCMPNPVMKSGRLNIDLVNGRIQPFHDVGIDRAAATDQTGADIVSCAMPLKPLFRKVNTQTLVEETHIGASDPTQYKLVMAVKCFTDFAKVVTLVIQRVVFNPLLRSVDHYGTALADKLFAGVIGPGLCKMER